LPLQEKKFGVKTLCHWGVFDTPRHLGGKQNQRLDPLPVLLLHPWV